MQAVGTLLVVAAALLAAAGAAKVARPRPAVLAMRSVGLPSGDPAVRLLGVAEITLGAVVILTASPLSAAAMGALYLAFAGFVVASMRSAERSSCGCFGESSTPPGILHIVVDLGAAVVAALAVFGEAPSLAELLDGGVLESVIVIGGCLLAVYLLVALLTTLPQTLSAVSDVAARGRGR